MRWWSSQSLAVVCILSFSSLTPSFSVSISLMWARGQCEDARWGAVCVWGAGWEDHPDPWTVGERDAGPRGPAGPAGPGCRGWLWGLLLPGIDSHATRAHTKHRHSYTHTKHTPHTLTWKTHPTKHSHWWLMSCDEDCEGYSFQTISHISPWGVEWGRAAPDQHPPLTGGDHS